MTHPHGKPVTVAVLGALLLGAAVGSSTPGSGGQVHACYSTKDGALRVVDAGEACGKKEAPLSWSQAGPAGATGPPGPSGEPGADAPASNDWVEIGGVMHRLREATWAENGNTYLAVERAPGKPQMTWDEARLLAEHFGGHLATITSAEEQQFIVDEVTLPAELFLADYAIGLQEAGEEEGDFHWVGDEEEFAYAAWRTGEPNNELQPDSAAQLERTPDAEGDGGWVDISPGEAVHGALIELDAPEAPGDEDDGCGSHCGDD